MVDDKKERETMADKSEPPEWELSYREIPQGTLDGARDGRDWFIAYLREGFTEEQAMALVVRPFVVNNSPPKRPPWWRR